ncbi:CAAD domain-containing protein [Prochlorococcus sp. MIT 1307]|uniref:CAAD domain-containing protein n=1 Tax=Prochlorococcus sp. MIT 1307 TaxID=3096219 RepID=UPI002A75D0A6|nr:CAAD domain-containing protein [Prochlorococcus sp. MIT 1307]
MSDSNPEENQAPGFETPPVDNVANKVQENSVSDRFTEVMGTINQTLGKIDWSQMGKYGKALGIIAVVIVAQVIIKVVIDTINFFPVVPGLLELLGVVVLGQWSWQNLSTSDKRNAVFERVQTLRKEYLG